jgi:serine/threonine protein kinase
MQKATAGKVLLNNRYQKVKRLGEGSYGTVYLAIDTKPHGIKRKADPKALQMFSNIEEGGAAKSSDVVMKDEEQKEALAVLADRSKVFKQNDAFAKSDEDAAQEEAQQYVALKKVKMNDFNVKIAM